MQPVAQLVKVSAPNYLQSLPIPDTVGGWFRLGCKYNLNCLINTNKWKSILNCLLICS